jgi:hypothetical protein
LVSEQNPIRRAKAARSEIVSVKYGPRPKVVGRPVVLMCESTSRELKRFWNPTSK